MSASGSTAAEATVKLKPGKDGPARGGHPWIFSGAIADVVGSVVAGSFVRVESSAGVVLGVGSYNPHGSIAVRLFARDDVAIDAELVRRRVADAHALRQRAALDSDAYRLVHGEGDGLPGVIVDVYAGHAVIQVLTAGAERLREALLDALAEVIAPRGVLERSTSGARREEGLEPRAGVVAGEVPPQAIEIREGRARYLVDIQAGQKTGFYLDQRPARQRVGQLASGLRVLNGFAYTGAFAVAAVLGGASHVTSVETSGPALANARENFAANGLDEGIAAWRNEDVFDVLAEARGAEPYDLIILDPPPYARHRADRDRAVRAYRELNRRAIATLKPGGMLLTFSCSAHIPRELFEHAVATAVVSPVRLQLLERLGAGADHPVLAGHPEAEYLTGVLCRRAG